MAGPSSFRVHFGHLHPELEPDAELSILAIEKSWNPADPRDAEDIARMKYGLYPVHYELKHRRNESYNDRKRRKGRSVA